MRWYSDGIEDVTVINGFMTIKVDPFLMKQGFIISCVVDGKVLFSFTKDDVASFTTDVVDEFEVVWTDEANYRIYRPDTDEKVPLFIWFHGAGERGDDTYLPLVDYRGAVCLGGTRLSGQASVRGACTSDPRGNHLRQSKAR